MSGPTKKRALLAAGFYQVDNPHRQRESQNVCDHCHDRAPRWSDGDGVFCLRCAYSEELPARKRLARLIEQEGSHVR